jgi:hypothetical protein
VATVLIRLVPGAVEKLMKEPGVQADLVRRGQAIARAAGPGHLVDLNVESHRASVIVITDTFEAILGEANHRNLTRAIEAGRD